MVFVFAGNKDSHKILDGFDIRHDRPRDRTRDCGVSCP